MSQPSCSITNAGSLPGCKATVSVSTGKQSCPATLPSRRPSKLGRLQTSRATVTRWLAALLAAIALLLVLQLGPSGPLQCKLKGPQQEYRQQSLQHQPFQLEVGAAMASGFGSAMRRLEALNEQADPLDRGSHIIVAATTDAEQSRWIDEQLGNITKSRVYVVEHDADRLQLCRRLTADNATEAKQRGCWPHLATGSGREASAYLQYIVDEWDRLPESILFVHGHETSWHRNSSADFVDYVQRMRWGEFGFGSLRTWGMLGFNFWDLAIMISPAEPERCQNEGRNAPEWWKRCEEQGQRLKRFWYPLRFNDTFGLPPFEVHAPGCCAEFVVRRDRIRARGRQFYVDMLAELNKVPWGELAPAFAYEHIWHVIFGEPWVSLGIGKCQLIHCNRTETRDGANYPPEPNFPYWYNRPPDADRVPHP